MPGTKKTFNKYLATDWTNEWCTRVPLYHHQDAKIKECKWDMCNSLEVGLAGKLYHWSLGQVATAVPECSQLVGRERRVFVQQEQGLTVVHVTSCHILLARTQLQATLHERLRESLYYLSAIHSSLPICGKVHQGGEFSPQPLMLGSEAVECGQKWQCVSSELRFWGLYFCLPQ